MALFDYEVEEEDRLGGSTIPGVRFHEVFGMNSGLKSAPLQFNRVAEFICTVAACWHNLPIDHYYDDFMLVCLKESTIKDQAGKIWKSSGQWFFSNLCFLLG